MKIQEVTIEGYQSHTNSTFRLSPGLTVITGPSDAGKTAIIRALRWFAFNEPTGEAFLHTIRNPDGSVKEAVDQVKVSVTFDNGITVTKTRRKGKTTYTHSAFPTAWEKAEIPPEIKETLGLVKQQYGDFETCLNFAFQLDAPFMLSESASVGAKVLGKLAGTEIVDKSISEVNKKTHQTRKEYLDPKAYEGYGYGKAPGGAVVTVITGTPYDINISAHVEYEKNVDRAEVLQQFTELVTEYVKSRVFNRNDDTKELSPIAYKKIAAILGTLSGVANYDDLTVNGGTADITIEPYEIPTVKKVSLT